MSDRPESNGVPYSGFGTLKFKPIIYIDMKISLNFGDAAEDLQPRERGRGSKTVKTQCGEGDYEEVMKIIKWNPLPKKPPPVQLYGVTRRSDIITTDGKQNHWSQG